MHIMSYQIHTRITDLFYKEVLSIRLLKSGLVGNNGFFFLEKKLARTISHPR